MEKCSMNLRKSSPLLLAVTYGVAEFVPAWLAKSAQPLKEKTKASASEGGRYKDSD
jgi:hypothetical protein